MDGRSGTKDFRSSPLRPAREDTQAPLLPRSQAVIDEPPGLFLDALVKRFEWLSERLAEDPLGNPVMSLGLDLMRNVERGQLTVPELASLVQQLCSEGFLHRAQRLAGYLGDLDGDSNRQRLRDLVRAQAFRPADGTSSEATAPVDFETFRGRLEREFFGVVITAHPTFNLSGELMRLLADSVAELGTASPREMTAKSVDLLDLIVEQSIEPEKMTLQREHELSLDVLSNLQDSLREFLVIVLEVAGELYPERWTELTPALLTIATWVGFDLDGRNDIGWIGLMANRLMLRSAQLQRWRRTVDELHEECVADAGEGPLPPVLEGIGERLAVALKETDEEVAAFTAAMARPDDAPQLLGDIARRIGQVVLRP